MQNFGLTDPKIRLTRKAALRAPKPKEAQKHVLEQQLSPRFREVESKSMKLHGLQRRLRRALRGDDLARTDGICRASPEWLVLCINNFCNLHCKMCDVGRGEEGTVFYANLVGSAKTAGARCEPAAEHVAGARRKERRRPFTRLPGSGSPTRSPSYHARIREICEALKRRGLASHVSITTNPPGYGRFPAAATGRRCSSRYRSKTWTSILMSVSRWSRLTSIVP